MCVWGGMGGWGVCVGVCGTTNIPHSLGLTLIRVFVFLLYSLKKQMSFANRIQFVLLQKRRYFGPIDDALFGKDHGKKAENIKNKKSKKASLEETDPSKTNNQTCANDASITQSLRLDMTLTETEKQEVLHKDSCVDGATCLHKTSVRGASSSSSKSLEPYRTPPSSPVHVQNKTVPNGHAKCASLEKASERTGFDTKQAQKTKVSPTLTNVKVDKAQGNAQKQPTGLNAISTTYARSGSAASTAEIAIVNRQQRMTEMSCGDISRGKMKSSALKTATPSKPIYGTNVKSKTSGRPQAEASLAPSKPAQIVIAKQKSNDREQTKLSSKTSTPSEHNQTSSKMNECISEAEKNESPYKIAPKPAKKEQAMSSRESITLASIPVGNEQKDNSAKAPKASCGKETHLELLNLDLDLPDLSTATKQPDSDCTMKLASLEEQMRYKKLEQELERKLQQVKLKGKEELARAKRRANFNEQRAREAQQKADEVEKEHDKLREQYDKVLQQERILDLQILKQQLKTQTKQTNSSSTNDSGKSSKSGANAQKLSTKQSKAAVKKIKKREQKLEASKEKSSPTSGTGTSSKKQKVTGTVNFTKIDHQATGDPAALQNTNQEIKSSLRQLNLEVSPTIACNVHPRRNDSVCSKQRSLAEEVKDARQISQANQSQQKQQQQQQQKLQNSVENRQQILAVKTTVTITQEASEKNDVDPAKTTVTKSKTSSAPKAMRWMAKKQAGAIIPILSDSEIQKSVKKQAPKQPTIKAQLFAKPTDAQKQKSSSPSTCVSPTTCLLHNGDSDEMILAVQQLPKTAAKHLSDIRNSQNQKAAKLRPGVTKINRPLQLGEVPVTFLMREHCKEFSIGFPEEDEEYENLRDELDKTYFAAKVLGWDAFQGSLYHFFRQRMIIRPTEFPRLASCTKGAKFKCKTKAKTISEISTDTKLTKKQRKRLAKSKAKSERENTENEVKLNKLFFGKPIQEAQNSGDVKGDQTVAGSSLSDVKTNEPHPDVDASTKCSSKTSGTQPSETSSKSGNSEKHPNMPKPPLAKTESKQADLSTERITSFKDQPRSKRLSTANSEKGVVSTLTQNQKMEDKLACAVKCTADVKPNQSAQQQSTGIEAGRVANAVRKFERVQDSSAHTKLGGTKLGGGKGVPEKGPDVKFDKKENIGGRSPTKRRLPVGETQGLKSAAKGNVKESPALPPQEAPLLLATGDASTSLHNADTKQKVTTSDANSTVTVQQNAQGIPLSVSVGQTPGTVTMVKSLAGQVSSAMPLDDQKQSRSSSATSKIPKNAKFTPGVAGPPIRKKKHRKRPEARCFNDLTLDEVEQSKKDMKKTLDKVIENFDKLSLDSGTASPECDRKILTSNSKVTTQQAEETSRTIHSSNGDAIKDAPTPNAGGAPRPTENPVQQPARRLVPNKPRGKRKLKAKRRIPTLTNVSCWKERAY